ncbi:peptidyl-prolyl cis-trans isomerase D [Loktanella atrilutea]|uniref:Peptidyl-prolyl cis-trans isomerase D n=1 Tax=Loktanella atrilutea TaxID=366533 RepID=A0A1M4TAD3_LOKAT|nr:peptidyl-prolyl cis-trans isomerase [Loktanella atrilutea]SHE41479.1 peptidyl-prolyl cis-trans isomerase D [Loktanella atrilutea]
MADKKKRTPIAVWIVMILIVGGLLGFGTGGFSGSVQRIGTAGSKDISIASYQNALNEQLRAIEAQVGSRVTFQQAQSMGLDRSVLSQVVTQRTLDNEAAELGLSVGDARVRDEVLRNPAFQSLSGSFDREAYASALRRVGLTEKDYETSIRDDMTRTLLQGAVVGGIPAAPVYADTIATFLGETRNIVTAPVTADQLTTPVPGPTDADLKTFYDENPDMFTAPEVRKITYALLTPDMLADKVTVDDAQVQDLYDQRIDTFRQPERRLVERLVFATEEDAAAAKAELDAGATTFDDLVSARGLAMADVDLGDVAVGDLGAAGEPVFAAATGDTVGPLDSDLGPALFRVNAVLAAEETSFEEAAPELRDELATTQARRVIQTDAETINDLIAGGATLDDLAERTDLELGTMDFTADSTDGPAAYEAFRTAAAAATEGAYPTLVNLDDGGIFALRLDSVTPPAVEPLDQVRDRLEAAWRAAAEKTAVLARAEEIAATVAADTDLTTLGLTPTVSDNLTRGSFVADTPQDFMTTVFEMQPAETRALPTETGAIIVRLNAVTPADLSSERLTAQASDITQQASAGIAQDIFDAYAEAIRARTDVVIDQSAVNAVNAQLQ